LRIEKAFAALFLVLGTVLLVSFGYQAIQAVRSESWPTVEGMVTESTVVQSTGRRDRKTAVPTITYRYSVDGVEHVGTRLFFGSQYSESWTAGAKWTTSTNEYIARYPPGTLLRVHYDPEHAATSVVEAGLKPAIVLPVGFSMMVVGVGVFAGFLGRRRMAKLAGRGSASMR